MGKYDDLFDAAPSPSPAAAGKYSDLFDEPGVVATQAAPTAVGDSGEGDGFLSKINAALSQARQSPYANDLYETDPSRIPTREKVAAQESPFIRGVDESLIETVPQSIGAGGRMLGELASPVVGSVEHLYDTARKIKELGEGKSLEELFGPEKTYPEFTAEDWGKLTGQVGLNAASAVPIFHGLRAGFRSPSPIRAEPLAPEPPPTQSMGPGTLAQDVSRALERRFTMQDTPIPEVPPDLAPAPPIEQTLPNIPSQPPVFNPELGPTMRPDFQMPLQTETAVTPGAQARIAELQKEKAKLDDKARISNAIGQKLHESDTSRLSQINQELGQPEAPQPAAPQVTIPPEDAAYAGEQPQPPSTEPVGGNVAGFEKVYGPGEVPAGETISPEDAWDAAHARAQSGKAQPYGFVDRARTGAITPEEMGDLIYEHHRLVERAAGMEGTPEYGDAASAAKDFANNVLKPAETAWHQKGMVMQIARPIDLSNMTGMDQLMQQELNRGIKPSEAPKFKQMAEDIKNGETEVAKAVERSDTRVRTKYAKVRDIPIEEAVARVKQMLKDCM